MSESLSLRVLCFAAVRDVVGTPAFTLELGHGALARDVVPALIARFSALTPWAGALRVAVNGAYANADTPLCAGDEIAVIPPVSGG